MDENKNEQLHENKLKKFLISPAGKPVMILLFYAIILILILLFVELDLEFVTYIIAILFAYFGWKSLNRITPNIFLIMPLVGWLFYFVIKGALSIVIGMFVAPFVLSKKIVNSIQSNIR